MFCFEEQEHPESGKAFMTIGRLAVTRVPSHANYLRDHLHLSRTGARVSVLAGSGRQGCAVDLLVGLQVFLLLPINR
jgi:hypothetical protein